MDKISYKGIKPKEIVWVTYFDENHNLTYCEVSDILRTVYFLYKYDSSKKEWIKTNYKSSDPTELRKYIKNTVVDTTEKIENKLEEVKPKRGRPSKFKLF